MLKISEVAKIWGVSLNTIRRWSQKGILREIRAYDRAHRRFKKEDVERIIREIKKIIMNQNQWSNQPFINFGCN